MPAIVQQAVQILMTIKKRIAAIKLTCDQSLYGNPLLQLNHFSAIRFFWLCLRSLRVVVCRLPGAMHIGRRVGGLCCLGGILSCRLYLGGLMRR